MLARLLLIALQIVAGWFGAHALLPYLQLGDMTLFAFGAAAAVIVWIIGLMASLVLRGIGRPGGGTLAFTFVFALLAAAVAVWGPQLLPTVPWGRIDAYYLTLAGAVIGYVMKK
jgi:hypothetical protein